MFLLKPLCYHFIAGTKPAASAAMRKNNKAFCFLRNNKFTTKCYFGKSNLHFIIKMEIHGGLLFLYMLQQQIKTKSSNSTIDDTSNYAPHLLAQLKYNMLKNHEGIYVFQIYRVLQLKEINRNFFGAFLPAINTVTAQ